MDDTAGLKPIPAFGAPRLFIGCGPDGPWRACSLLGGSTDTTRPLELLAENPTVACDNAPSHRRAGIGSEDGQAANEDAAV